MTSERSLFLHYLRILSALIVVLGHAKEFFFLHMNENAILPEKLARLILSLGGSAVLVFFFLSGYLVGGKVLQDSIDGNLYFGIYIFNRMTRLWIVLLPALLITFILNAFTCRNLINSLYCTADPGLASHASLPPVFSQHISDFLANAFFLQPFKGVSWGGNGPLWSLSYEFWYYLVFFSFVSILGSVLNKNFNYGLIFHSLVIFVASKILNFEWLFLGSIWVCGALTNIFLNIPSVRSTVAKYYKFVTYKFTFATIFIIIPILIILKNRPRLVSFPITVIFLAISIAIMSDETQSFIEKKWQSLIIRGSEISFSLYLIHFPLLALAAKYLTPINRWEMSVLKLMIMLVIALVVLITAYIFAWLTEFNLARVRHWLLSLKK